MQTPEQLAQKRYEIAIEFVKLGERKVELMKSRAEYYTEYRSEFKSDTGVLRAWELTEAGLEYLGIKEKMKGMQNELSAIKTLIEVATMEARNYY